MRIAIFALDSRRDVFWGRRVADVGVGVAPIPRQQLTVERLVNAIDRVTTDRVMQQRAAKAKFFDDRTF